MGKLLKWGDRALSWGAGILLLYLFLTKFVLPRPSEAVDPHWRLPVGQPVLVEFSSSTCPSCIAMKPIIGVLERQFRGKVAIRRYSFDNVSEAEQYEAQNLAGQFGVRLTPTYLVAGSDGKITARFLGPTSYLALEQALSQALKHKESK